MMELVESIYKYNNSALGLINTLTTDYSALGEEFAGLQEKIANPILGFNHKHYITLPSFRSSQINILLFLCVIFNKIVLTFLYDKSCRKMKELLFSPLRTAF